MENALIPIINACGKILYFAYEDKRKANKEKRKGRRKQFL